MTAPLPTGSTVIPDSRAIKPGMDISLPVLIRDYAAGLPRIEAEIDKLQTKIDLLRRECALVKDLLAVVEGHTVQVPRPPAKGSNTTTEPTPN